MGWGGYPFTCFTTERTEAQRGGKACPRTHSKSVAEARIEPGSLSRAKHFLHHSELCSTRRVHSNHRRSHCEAPDAVGCFVPTAALWGLYSCQSHFTDLERPVSERNSVKPWTLRVRQRETPAEVQRGWGWGPG